MKYMNDRNAQFYFGNLGADVMRCVLAAQAGDEKKYDDSLARAQRRLRICERRRGRKHMKKDSSFCALFFTRAMTGCWMYFRKG